jgi:carbamoylphosphate synthase small subunit
MCRETVSERETTSKRKHSALKRRERKNPRMPKSISRTVLTMMYVLSVDMDRADDEDDARHRLVVVVDLGTKADCVEKA